MISSLILAAACGGVCQQSYVVRQKAVYAVPYVAPVVAPVYYFVGASVRASAIHQQQMQDDPDYADFQAFKAWKQAQSAPAEAQPVQQTAISVHCGKCHTKAEPAGGYYLEAAPGISAEAITKALRKISSGEMPKDHKLTREEKNAIMQELLSLEAGTEEPPPEPEPSNPQGGSE